MNGRPELSFDGCGINGPDEYRTRLATFERARWDTEQVKHYGRLFAAAPELLTMCVEMREVYRRKRRSEGCDGYDHGIMAALDSVIAKAGTP